MRKLLFFPTSLALIFHGIEVTKYSVTTSINTPISTEQVVDQSSTNTSAPNGYQLRGQMSNSSVKPNKTEPQRPYTGRY